MLCCIGLQTQLETIMRFQSIEIAEFYLFMEASRKRKNTLGTLQSQTH